MKPGDPARDGARIYGRRRGHKLHSHQKQLMQELLPRLEIPLSERPGALDPKGLFEEPQREEIWLEIGFGGGEHLAEQAARNPHVGLIGSEFFVNGIASLLSQIEKQAINNIRLHTVDARRFLQSLAPKSLDRAFLLFPDPWPKSRHHKRRFVSDWSLDELARVLKPGAQFRVATDINDYCRWTLDHIRRHREFTWPPKGPEDWRIRPDDWPATRYEAKALREGRTPVYLTFRRKP